MGAGEAGMMNVINGQRLARRFSGRLIPKRGQVKMGIMVGLAHTVTSIFSHSPSTSPKHFS